MKRLIDNQQLVTEWNWDKNQGIDISAITGGSDLKVWWKCSKGHEWQSIVGNRFRLHSSCPYCAGLLPIKGENDLETLYPTLAEEWHPTKNGNLHPSDFLIKSGKKVWWQCKYGHEWQAAIYSRTAGSGCPICKKSLKTSEPEQVVYFYVHKYFPDAINSYRSHELENKEIDVFIPSIKAGIEYDGSRYHKNVSRDYYKDSLCQKHGIALYRIRESKCPPLNTTTSRIFTIPNRSKDEFFNALKWLLASLGVDSPDIDIERDLSAIRENQFYLTQKNSFSSQHPELVKEWCSYKNGVLNPSQVSYKSHKRVWWKCPTCGYEWLAPISSRSNGFGCPKCGVKRMVNVRNQHYIRNNGSLLDANPDFLEEWDYERNEDVTPGQLSVASNQKVWWRCQKCGHGWEATVCERKNGRSCPICGIKNRVSLQRQRAVLRSGSLLQTHPEVASEWHPTKNKDLSPEMVSAGSSLKVWWNCQYGHEWQAAISLRAKGRGCPYCSNKKILSGYNDLQTRFPDISKEWDNDKNGNVKPSEVFPYTNKKYWWHCDTCGYEWQASPNKRCNGRGCPICALKTTGRHKK